MDPFPKGLCCTLLPPKGEGEHKRNYSSSQENIPIISDHVPTHKKPVRDEEFGSYLAGLIEGDGYICLVGSPNFTISFHVNDAPLAYYIKKRVGFGTVSKVKDKNALIYRANKSGTIKIAQLINGKLRTDKIASFNSVLNHINKKLETPLEIKEKDQSSLRRSYWLAGFTDADGSFQIKAICRKDRKQGYEIRLKLQIDQKTKFILDQIKEEFGGYLGNRKPQDTWYYETTSFGSAKKVINYFDYYHLLSSKHINYLKWRKVYRIVQRKEHITKKGIESILKIKSTMNSYSKEYLNYK